MHRSTNDVHDRQTSSAYNVVCSCYSFKNIRKYLFTGVICNRHDHTVFMGNCGKSQIGYSSPILSVVTLSMSLDRGTQ